ncbi:hypothetical protein MGYG_08962 [Nannizzia gypsea CBS 118893]|uniref:Uncharacterized protein n=1 Tax=Arthroderma gypseum (strain ATCC MYA-4604 / CBS 118893) TaxID=535722 RepID=E4UPY5_ARTGP|nr:hypothetical protein MGYG_08962 [Nannizzia gypsea CBS 118893]EFQ99119.1 hypothetical protein MGYG_08962 [Nannizzia gypsea CBS 118893]
MLRDSSKIRVFSTLSPAGCRSWSAQGHFGWLNIHSYTESWANRYIDSCMTGQLGRLRESSQLVILLRPELAGWDASLLRGFIAATRASLDTTTRRAGEILILRLSGQEEQRPLWTQPWRPLHRRRAAWGELTGAVLTDKGLPPWLMDAQYRCREIPAGRYIDKHVTTNYNYACMCVTRH